MPVRAVVVDDLPDVAESLARLLQAMGCAATFVTESAKAMAAVAAIEAELVFLDLAMPHVDGYKLAMMLRKTYGDAIVLVAMTAYGDDTYRDRSTEAGFDAHLQKPIESEVVESMLAAALKNRRGRVK
jgi:CheY-like chemotaxis protein